MNTHLLPRPKSYEDAQNAFLRQMGDPRLLNKYLATSLVFTLAIIAGLVGLNFRTATTQRERIVVRIDDVGRAVALGMTSLNYTVQPNEVKYFLGQFVHDYYGRNRTTIHEDFGRAMLFLNAPMAQQRMQEETRTKAIEKFSINGEDEIEITVKNIVLGEMTKSPYTAQIDLEKIYRMRGGNETKRETYVVTIVFSIASEVPNSALLVNPLGFTVLTVHDDQAFETKEKQ